MTKGPISLGQGHKWQILTEDNISNKAPDPFVGPGYEIGVDYREWKIIKKYY